MGKAITLLGLFFVTFSLQAQVAINSTGTAPNPSSMLDIESTTSGLLIPRMTLSDRDNISSPATGLTVFVTDDNTFYYYDGTNWNALQTTGKSWLLEGNSGTNGTQFLGTTDAQPLVLKTNNVERLRIKENGVIGINTPPDDTILIKAESDSHDIIGSFVSNRASSDDIGVRGIVANTDYYGIGGYFQGGWRAVEAVVIPSGSNYYTGVYSYVSGGSGTNYGNYTYVDGVNNNNYGNYLNIIGDGTNFGVLSDISGNGTNFGVLANASGNGTNIGIRGNTSGGTLNYSVYAVTDTGNTAGAAILGSNSNTQGNGIIGVGNGITSITVPSSGAGIVGNGTLNAIVGYTEYDDNSAVAVRGEFIGTTNTDATGVLGYSMPTTYYGYGVKGIGGWIGVYGETDSDGYYGVYSNGDMGASGTKTFAVDYPLDPANKILKHFSIESDEVLNVYRGNVVLNQQREAVVKMPVYFKAVNKNYSYQLTAIGSPATGIYIKKEIGNGDTFVIAGGNPGQKISWVVYAERNDPYLQQYPEKRKVIIDKNEREKGKYIMPELYGQPKEKGIFYSNTKQNKAKAIAIPKDVLKNKDPKINKAFKKH